jgi:hypothetical protein
MAFAEGKVIHPDHLWCRICRQSSLSDDPQQSISADRHAQLLSLTCTSFTAKRETELLQSGGQSHRATCSDWYDCREALGERLVRARPIQAAEASDVQA